MGLFLRIIQVALFLIPLVLSAQEEPVFRGQISFVGSYTHENMTPGLLSSRYIPEFNYSTTVDSIHQLDFEISANVASSFSLNSFDSINVSGTLLPYRVWARYIINQFELRLGLQKIDFGSAVVLRPLQWFNQIDPRDPLALTNGVLGILGKYYFENNANIWFWVLYGNTKPRGFDVAETNWKYPEIGGRFQYPVPRGEAALSCHYRLASTQSLPIENQLDQIPELRIGLDAKWDIEIGLWFEAVYIHKFRDIDQLTYQVLVSLGMDYTFEIGNGLNIMFEHLVASFDRKPFLFENYFNVTAATASYPLGFFDRINSVMYYSWNNQGFSFIINYEHQFEAITGYAMIVYNSASQLGIQQNDLVNQAAGVGIRIMIVYNY